MKPEKRFLRIYATLVLGTAVVTFAGFATHRRWLTDVAALLLGLTIQTIILALAWLTAANRSLDSRPVAVRILLTLILAASVLGILAFQVHAAAAIPSDYAQQTR
jgi:hypothetical protein